MLQDSRPWAVIAAEIEKCEVVCSNGHRRRTAASFNWRRAAYVPVAQSG